MGNSPTSGAAIVGGVAAKQVSSVAARSPQTLLKTAARGGRKANWTGGTGSSMVLRSEALAERGAVLLHRVIGRRNRLGHWRSLTKAIPPPAPALRYRIFFTGGWNIRRSEVVSGLRRRRKAIEAVIDKNGLRASSPLRTALGFPNCVCILPLPIDSPPIAVASSACTQG